MTLYVVNPSLTLYCCDGPRCTGQAHTLVGIRPQLPASWSSSAEPDAAGRHLCGRCTRLHGPAFFGQIPLEVTHAPS